MYISNAVIEVTRQCNMKCKHCLRGEAENLEIKGLYIELFMRKISSIGTLTITGGEPALAPQAIKNILHFANYYNVDIGNFYIVTNGKIVPDSFMQNIVSLYCYCSDNEISGLALSLDQFHETIPKENVKKLEVFNFLEKRKEIRNEYIIHSGHGAMWGNDKFPDKYLEYEEYENKFEFAVTEGELYLSSNGNIVAGCDWSYDDIDTNEDIFICDVHDLAPEKIKQFVDRGEA